ncbi:MAG: Co2+/Mg2+ efflux protein ApaG [Myxococcales bacterium]|nr:Co2+/Mg2+ efflux protein ApaG [Myxococcales bacterium]
MTSSTATTRNIRVDVRAALLPDRSNPTDNEWFFAYEITIQNLGADTVQLISREWQISNAAGSVEIVRGPGVVGHQPTLKPREGFQYTSGCPLDSAFGSMKGTYHMVTADGERFDVEIAEFALVDPAAVN